MARGVIDKSELRKRMLQVRELVGDHLLRSVELWAAVAEARAPGSVPKGCGSDHEHNGQELSLIHI